MAQNGKTAEWELNKGIWTVSINSGSADLLMVSYSFGIPSFFFSFVGSLVRWFLLSFFGSLVRWYICSSFVFSFLVVCSFVRSFFRSFVWFVGWCLGWLVGSFVGSFVWFVGWCRLVSWLVRSFVRGSFVRSFVWFVGCCRLVSWLVGWLVRLFILLFHTDFIALSGYILGPMEKTLFFFNMLSIPGSMFIIIYLLEFLHLVTWVRK